MVYSLPSISGTHFLSDFEAHLGLLALHPTIPPVTAIACLGTMLMKSKNAVANNRIPFMRVSALRSGLGGRIRNNHSIN